MERSKNTVHRPSERVSGISGRIKRTALEWMKSVRGEVDEVISPSHQNPQKEEDSVGHINMISPPRMSCYSFRQAFEILDIPTDQTPEYVVGQVADHLSHLQRNVYSLMMNQSPLAAFCHHVLEKLFLTPVFLDPERLVVDQSLDDYLLTCIKVALPSETILPPAIRDIDRTNTFRSWQGIYHHNAAFTKLSFFQEVFQHAINRYIFEVYAQPDENPRLSLTSKLNCERDKLEQFPFRKYLQSVDREAPHEFALIDYLPEGTPQAALELLARILPRGMDSRHLYDTSLFLRGLFRHGARLEEDLGKIPLGKILQSSIVSGSEQRYFHLQGALTITKNKEGRYSTLHNCLKDILIWRKFHEADVYEQKREITWDSSEDLDAFDEEEYGINENHVLTFMMNLQSAVRSSKNIRQVFETLFPDMHPRVFFPQKETGKSSPLKGRFIRLYNVADQLVEDKPLVQFFRAFVSCLQKFPLSEWDTPVEQISNTPWKFLKKMSKLCFRETDPANKERYESYVDMTTDEVGKWNFLNEMASTRIPPHHRASSQENSHQTYLWQQLIRRLTGWRKIQRDLHLQLIDDVLHQLGWKIEDHIVDPKKSKNFITTFRELSINPHTLNDLLLLIGHRGEEILLAHFPLLKK